MIYGAHTVPCELCVKELGAGDSVLRAGLEAGVVQGEGAPAEITGFCDKMTQRARITCIIET